MKPLLSCLATTCAVGAVLGLAVPNTVSAQPSALPPPNTNSASPAGQNAPPEADNLINGDFSLAQREDRLAALLDSSLADGSLSKAEYSRANDELAAIRTAENRMRQRNHGELTDSDTFRLEGHIKALIGSIRWKS